MFLKKHLNISIDIKKIGGIQMHRIMKAYVLFLLVLIMSIFSVHAVNFELNATPIKNKIAIDEVAKFKLEIKNNFDKTQKFRIYTLDYPTWDIHTEPIVNPILLDVAPNSKSYIELIVDPLTTRNIIVGPHFVNVKVRSQTTNEALGIPLKVSIISRDSLIGGYVPTIITNVKIPKKIDPRDEIPIEIILNNQNIIDYSDLVIKIDSNLIKDAIDCKLGPKEEKTLHLTKKIDYLTQPQTDNIMVAVLKGEKVIAGPITSSIEIVEYLSKKEADVKKKFLKTERDIVVYSNNKGYSGKVSVETSFFKCLFSSTKPKAKILKENNKRYFVWDISLDENNSMKLSITESYKILFFIIILAMILILVYYAYRSPLTINKDTKNIVKKEGGIFSLKVILHIKNRSSKKIEDIELKEVVPRIAGIEKDMSIGTLKPTRILNHEKKGSIIKWDIDKLDIGEERILSYKIISQLPILGDLSLPEATAKFRYNNKDVAAHSNRANVSSK